MTTQLDLNRTALVIVDPLIDLLSPQSVIWDLIGDHVQEIDLVAKLRRLRAAAERAGVPVMYSRIEVSENEYESMACKSGLQSLMADRKMCVPGKGGRYHPELEPSEDTILLAPRKGPSSTYSDFAVQMRRRGLDTAVFAGMIANLCVESHVREAAEEGFGAYVVSDAVGAVNKDALDGALGNFALLATGTMATDELCTRLTSRAAQPVG